jgi:hypothetical protein
MIDWSIRLRCTGGLIDWMLDLVVHRYPSGCGKDVSVFFQDPVHFLLLQREDLCRGHECGGDLLLIVSTNHKEDTFLSL